MTYWTIEIPVETGNSYWRYQKAPLKGHEIERASVLSPKASTQIY